MERRRGADVLTDDVERMHVPTIHGWLSNEAYWSLGRSVEAVSESLRHSRVYGVFRDGRQIAFARVITDDVSFAYLCDVFVESIHRRESLGSWVLDTVLDDLRDRGIAQILLATRDAHTFYERAGFHPLTRPERWLEVDPTSAPPRGETHD
jgi:GNAT superfamily N-acetyltransferase